MNTLVRMVSAAAVLGTALVLTGCATKSSARKAPQVQVVEEFAVVESSTEKELTPAQLDELRRAVINYLQEQGMTGDRLYYVKVTFPRENPDDVAQWAVVRVGNLSGRTYTVLAAYPGRDDYYPYDYYRTAYFSNYGGFSRWGYYDPFDYNYGYSSRPVPPFSRPDHPPGHKPDDDNKPRHPPGTHTRWDNTPRTDGDQPRRTYPPRSANPEQWARERAERRGGYTRSDNSMSGRSYSQPPEHSYSPPSAPERSYSPPPASDSGSGRVDSSNVGIQQSTSSEKER